MKRNSALASLSRCTITTVCSAALATTFVVPSGLLHAQVSSGAAGPTQPASAPPAGYVSSSASATVHVRPDLAIFTFQVDELGLSPAEASRRVAARTDSIRRALGTLGVPRDSMISARHAATWKGRIEPIVATGCRPRTERGPDGRNCDPFSDTTYTARDVIEVRMHALDRLGAALDTLAGRRITTTSNVSFRASDIAAAQDAALREATESARRQASAMASAAGATLGRIIVLSSDPGSRNSDFGSAVPTAGRETIRNTDIVRPSIAVTMSVNGRWEVRERSP